MGAQASAFRSGKRCAASSLFPRLFRFQGSKSSQAWPVVAAPRWLAERAIVTAHLETRLSARDWKLHQQHLP